MSAPKLVDDCFRPHERRMRHGEAIALLKSRTPVVAGTETVDTAAANGRVLADAVGATRPIPYHTNAAVDGYGFGWTETVAKSGGLFVVAGRAAAGHPFDGALATGEAVHILTGAIVPEGVETIVMQEDVELAAPSAPGEPAQVRVPPGVKRGANIRKAGEDVAAGATMYEAGHVIRPQDLAALASAGIAHLLCRRRLRVGLISTGDEVVPADGRTLAEGQVFDSNSPMLAALVSAAGADPVPFGIWPDRAGEIRARLAEAAATCDLLLTTGGASQGQEDHMAAALDTLGQRHMWQLAIKPGRPLMFGQIGDTAVVGLPGNPVAVCVCFLMYVFPMLRQMSGAGWPSPKAYDVAAGFTLDRKKPGRREFWRASLAADPDSGSLRAVKFPNDGSGLITGLRVSDGLIEVPEDARLIAEGEPVRFIPFSQFGIPERV